MCQRKLEAEQIWYCMMVEPRQAVSSDSSGDGELDRKYCWGGLQRYRFEQKRENGARPSESSPLDASVYLSQAVLYRCWLRHTTCVTSGVSHCKSHLTDCSHGGAHGPVEFVLLCVLLTRLSGLYDYLDSTIIWTLRLSGLYDYLDSTIIWTLRLSGFYDYLDSTIIWTLRLSGLCCTSPCTELIR